MSSPIQIDATILLLTSTPGLGTALKWSTPREVVGMASEAGALAGIFIPPAFSATSARSLFAPENAIQWAVGVMRKLGTEIKVFDSLYSASYWAIQGSLSCIDPEREEITCQVQRAMDLSRNTKFSATDKWEKGLVEHFDYNIAAGIFDERYGISIIDAMKALNAPDGMNFPVAYGIMAKNEGYTPADFCNGVCSQLALVDVLTKGQYFLLKDTARPSGVHDEYAALIAIVNGEAESAGRVFSPVEFERRCLGLEFERASSGDGDEEVSRRADHA